MVTVPLPSMYLQYLYKDSSNLDNVKETRVNFVVREDFFAGLDSSVLVVEVPRLSRPPISKLGHHFVSNCGKKTKVVVPFLGGFMIVAVAAAGEAAKQNMNINCRTSCSRRLPRLRSPCDARRGMTTIACQTARSSNGIARRL